MVKVGERWKFATAQVDFTIVSLDSEYAYYRMNWDERQRQALRIPVYHYMYDFYNRPYAVLVRRDPDQICKVQLASFVNGNVVRSTD